VLTTREIVHSSIRAVADLPRPLTGAEELAGLGLESLALARLVIALETETGVDPFAADADLADVRTVDQLVEVYARAVGGDGV
jgi:acyl carrier protein